MTVVHGDLGRLLLGATGEAVEILAREAVLAPSSFACERIRCRLPNGEERVVFCKRAIGSRLQAYGHRGGIAYEARVYERVLAPLEVSVPRLLGVHRADGDDTWLVLEYLEGAEPVQWLHEEGAMERAAAWIGRFHRITVPAARDPDLAFLIRYDAAYYRGWCRRTLDYAGDVPGNAPWLEPLCRRAPEALDELLADPLSVIHGEYYPANILVRAGRVHPVDWESAAIGAGEIDLAALTHEWPDDVAHACIEAYRESRWGTEEPPAFRRRLNVSRLYLELRWLGENPDWPRGPDTARALAALRALGEELELI